MLEEARSKISVIGAEGRTLDRELCFLSDWYANKCQGKVETHGAWDQMV